MVEDFGGRAEVMALGSQQSAEMDNVQPQTLLKFPVSEQSEGVLPTAFAPFLQACEQKCEDSLGNREKPSTEQILLYERMRTQLVSGIVFYLVEPSGQSILLASPTQLLNYSMMVRSPTLMLLRN